MALIATDRHAARYGRKRRNGLEFNVIFFVTLTFFVLAGAFERLMPWSWRASESGPRRPSLLQQAWASADTCTSYAFMG